MSIKLHAHQLDAIERMHNGCILWGGVGTGKTVTSLQYYMENEAPKDIYVITTAKKRDSLDWQKEATWFGIDTKERFPGRGTITIDSWHNVKKYVTIKDAFFIFDEQHASGSGAWAGSFIKISRNNSWIILSGTPGDTWLDYVPVFIARGYFKNRTEFKERHTIYSHYGGYPKLERYLRQAHLQKLRDSILVEMPMERHTKRYTVTHHTSYDSKAYKDVTKTRQNPETGEPFLNASAFVQYLRYILNKDESRIEVVDKIVREKKRVIIFYNFNYELEILREWGAKVDGLQVREWNGQKHDDIPTEGDWVYLVQYNGAEAWNCTTTDTMIFYSLTYSYKMYEQAMGRIDRMNTPYTDLYYHVLMSKGVLDKRIWMALQGKKDFNESSIRTWFKKALESDLEGV